MLKLARWSTTHRLYVAIAWLLALVTVVALALSVKARYANNFTIPNSDAQRAADLLRGSFPAQAGDRDEIVFAVTRGTVRSASVRTRMSGLFAQVARLPHVAGVLSPYGPSGGRAISADGRIAFATVLFDRKANMLPKSAAKGLIAAAGRLRMRGLEIELGGPAVEQAEQRGFGVSTAVGLIAAIVVLVITFGSLIAMGLPILTALFGLGTGLGLIALFTHIVDTPDFSSELAAMIGLGVGIDYALFIVTRFREAYTTPGRTLGDVRESVLCAMDTAGRAVLFAGSTVVIALLGMMLLGVSFLYGVALSASIGVLLVMIGSLTLLPALLTLAGRRLARPGWRARRRGEQTVRPPGTRAWLRWSAFVRRHPGPLAALAAVLMLLIAAPVSAMRLGSSDASNDPPSSTTHKAYSLLARGFGAGFNGPLLIVAQAGESRAAGQSRRPALSAARLAELRSALAATAHVAAVTPARLNGSGGLATLSVYPRSSPQAYATTQLVSRLRAQVIPPLARRTGMRVYVGGFTAGGVDFATTLASKLPLFIGVVVLLSALLLLAVFRSLVIPLQAAVMNLLSIGASLGVTVVAFQWGWLHSLTGLGTGPIESFIPVMLFAIVFGLSMDYEVFLISRIHEQWTRSGQARRAVGEGLALTGRVVTAAAAIMICVFLSFMLGENRVIREFGLSLSAAVFLDAVIVRCLLLPATLDLLGALTWRIPAALERRLPHLSVEGSSATALAPAPALADGQRRPGRAAREGVEG